MGFRTLAAQACYKNKTECITIAKIVLVHLLALFLFGCAAKTIDIDGAFPTPLVPQLPLSLGVYYPEQLRNFSYTEFDDYSGKDQYIINSGASQLTLFNTILPQMFRDVIILDSPQAGGEQVDAVLIPQLNEFQLGLPDKTKLSVFEVWMQYNMRLTLPNGDFIADWNMSAYGKSPTETFKSVDQGVKNAAEVAMRDLAASLSLGFADIEYVDEWLKENNFLP